jgi:hypothetical protein
VREWFEAFAAERYVGRAWSEVSGAPSQEHEEVDKTQAPDPEPCAVDISGFAVAFVLGGLAS